MTASLPDPLAGYYRHHVFFCLNQREGGQVCCAQHGAEQAFVHCKDRIKSLGLAGPGGVRVNRAGCLDRCAAGPLLVIYPEGVWYTYLDTADIDEIIDSHLVAHVPVTRLLVPPQIGR